MTQDGETAPDSRWGGSPERADEARLAAPGAVQSGPARRATSQLAPDVTLDVPLELAADAAVVGWDIGGVNTKVTRVAGGRVAAARTRPYEVQRDPRALPHILRRLATDVGLQPGDAHAVTMTAELSQLFRLKRDGVHYVLDALTDAFAGTPLRVFAVDGRFLTVDAARREPVAVAASNWAATARVVAGEYGDALLVDVGTTTADLIPILDGRVAAVGRTDPERLASGELVYTGALRTPVEAIVRHVPFGDGTAGVSAEGFALVGDAHLWRGALAAADYTVPTPDGRPATREHAGERLARVICADRELLDERGVDRIAEHVARAQVAQLAEAGRRVCARHPAIRTAVVAGLGDFVGAAAAAELGLAVEHLASRVGDEGARSAPATAVALLLARAGARRP
jgi:(4-(4-[2-(gamma-L-glutamylamino)ethyl]phenoxymethyl)furan-2-yl)methanamine synthase